MRRHAPIFERRVRTGGNFDEGLDLDEADDGNVYLVAVNFEASGNLDENVKVTKLQNEASAPGTIIARFNAVTVNDSIDGDGIKLEALTGELLLRFTATGPPDLSPGIVLIEIP